MSKNRKTSIWNTEKAISAVEDFVRNFGRLPTAKEMKSGNRLPSRRTFETKVGISFYKYGERYYPELVKLSETRHRQHVADSMRERSEWTQEKLIAAVKNFVVRHNRLPASQEYTSKNGLPGYTIFCRIAEAALFEYLEGHFHEYINRDLTLNEETAAIEQDQSTIDMMMTM